MAATAAPAAPAARRAGDLDWAERHRPQHLKDIVGNGSAVGTMKKWADSWVGAVPDTRALVLQGTPGIGKTSAAHALARDMGWDVIELNASDSRNATIIKRIAGTGSQYTTFAADGSFRKAIEGGRTLIILDEADNLYERGGKAASSGGEDLSDRGGKKAIVDTIKASRQPIVLIVNDYYNLTKGSGAALRTLAESVKFQRPQVRSVAKRLAEICKAEGVAAHPDALARIAEEAHGDLRAAVNDLQAAAQGVQKIGVDDVRGLGLRDTGRSVFDAMPDIFKSMDIERARHATRDIDENPEHIILWVDENLPLEYKQPADLARGYQALSRADIYLGRVRRRQYYGLWSYASQMMTAGVAMAKTQPYKGWTRWQFPTWLRRMSSSRAQRNLRDGLARKVGRLTHTSIREARSESLEPFAFLFQHDPEFAVSVGADLALTPEEAAFLLDTKSTTKKVKTLMEDIGAELERRPKESAGIWADDKEPAPTPPPKRGPRRPEEDETTPKDPPKTRAKPKAKQNKDEEAQEAEPAEEEAKKPAPQEGQKGLFEF